MVSLITATDGVGDAGVIRLLHRKGLYHDAVELYLAGVGRRCFLWPDSEGGGLNKNEGSSVLDFHDLSLIGGCMVFHPEVQRLLMEYFYPPLDIFLVPGNVGVLEVGR